MHVCEVREKRGCIEGLHTSVERVTKGHMRAGAAPEAREVRAAVDPPAHQLQVSAVTRRNAVAVVTL